MNAIERVLDLRKQAIVLGTHSRDPFVFNRDSTHHQNTVGYRAELIVELRHFAAVFHRLDQHGLKLATRALRFLPAEKFLFVIFVLVVVHKMSAWKAQARMRNCVSLSALDAAAMPQGLFSFIAPRFSSEDEQFPARLRNPPAKRCPDAAPEPVRI